MAGLGRGGALEMSAADVARLRDQLVRRGFPISELPDDQVRAIMEQLAIGFRDNAPTTAAQAAKTILDGVRNEEWRILIGDDAKALDRMVRESPEDAYERSFLQALQAQGHLRIA